MWTPVSLTGLEAGWTRLLSRVSGMTSVRKAKNHHLDVWSAWFCRPVSGHVQWDVFQSSIILSLISIKLRKTKGGKKGSCPEACPQTSLDSSFDCHNGKPKWPFHDEENISLVKHKLLSDSDLPNTGPMVMSRQMLSHLPPRAAQGNGHGYFRSMDGQKNIRLEAACKTQWRPLVARYVCHPSHLQPQELGNAASWPYSCLSKIIFQESIREIPNSSKCGSYCSVISPCIYQKKESSLDSWDGTWFNPRLSWGGRLKYGYLGRKLFQQKQNVHSNRMKKLKSL